MLILLLFVLGLVFLILEIFVPGGILGAIGVILLVAGIFVAADTFQQGVIWSLIFLVVLGVILGLSFRFPWTRRLWQRLSLKESQSNQRGYVAPKPDYANYVGREGVALSLLRPAGVADFDGARMDVVTEGGFINNGTKVYIIAVEGTRIIVRELGLADSGEEAAASDQQAEPAELDKSDAFDKRYEKY
ncbi:MAG: hypothetical protein LBT32_01645 [Peptococcaceae bacterium]|jgi:membrane-bound ClpP family serine protease|nr:hypothetical protein [Peptococcaceae bacterium]